MFQRDSSTQSTKLKERNLLHKRISDLTELQRIYDLGELLGKGSFGTVVKANHKASNVNWAIKIINKSQAGASRVMLVEREIYILKLVNHPNIILLDRVFESSKTIYLVFELCTGSLARSFKIKKRFEENETLTVIRSLAAALSYLHKNDIVHRDLKLENILIAANPENPDDNLHIKVTDFGLSAVRGGTGYENMLHDCCGTITYMAPEMIFNKSYSQQCDVWSMGIIMYILMVGKFPFYSTNDQHLQTLVKSQELDFSSLSCSLEAKHLLGKMLQKNPAFRMTAAEVENHPWISGNRSILQSHSSNVLDMMRMWKNEMMDTSEDQNSSDNNNKQLVGGKSTVADQNLKADECREETVISSEKIISKISLRGDKESIKKSTNESPYRKQRFWENENYSMAEDSLKLKKSDASIANEDIVSSKCNRNRISVATDTSDLSYNDDDDDSAEEPSAPFCGETARSSSRLEPIAEKKRASSYGERRSRLPSSRIPDFSHVPAKVDSNLANLRRGAQAQRKRERMRSQQSAA